MTSQLPMTPAPSEKPKGVFASIADSLSRLFDASDRQAERLTQLEARLAEVERRQNEKSR